MTKLRALVGVFLRSATTRARLVVLALLGLLIVGLAFVVRNDAGADAPGELIDRLGLTLVVPVGSLLVATGALGQLRNEGSLIYVWLRPVSRGSIALASWIAALAIALPATVVPLALAAAVAGGSSSVVAGTVLASAAGVIAYCGVFSLLGLLTRQAVIWGVAYVLVWEGVLAALGSGVNRLALRSYTRSVLERVGDVDLPLSGTSAAVSILVLVGVACVTVGLTTLRLRRMDVE